ncbi:MAG: hypothetical protein II899_05065, partial [Bacteroidales bacterium]|nr:hypothetical protein [Bacteroidales bacterium]
MSNTTVPSYLLASFSTNKDIGEGKAGDALFVDDVWFVYNKRIASLSIGGTAVASSVINSLNAQSYTNANGATTNTFTSSTAIPTYDYTTGVCSDNFPAVTATTVSGFATASIFHAATASEPYVTIKITHTDNSYYYYKVRFTNVSSGPTITLNNGGTYNVCAGDPINVTASGATSYTWSNGLGNTATVHPTAAGNYTVTGTDANGCTATAVAYVTINSLPTITINGQASGSLSGCSSVALSAGGAATPQNYNWSNGTSSTNTITVTQSGTYTVTGTNSYGCSATATANVTVNPLPTVSISGPATACSADAVTLTATGASSYVWGNNLGTSASITPTASGDYTVTGTDTHGCTNTATHHLTINTTPTVSITGTTAICSGSSTTLTATSNMAGTTYEWQDHSTNATLPVTTGGTYSVTGTLNGCSSNAQVTVTESATPATPALTGDTRCGAGQVSLAVNNPDNSLTYNWYLTDNTGVAEATGASYTPTVTGTTTYYVSAQNAQGCSSARASVTATVNPLPAAPTITNITNCGTAEVVLTPAPSATIHWYTDQEGTHELTNGSLTVNATTTYYAATTDNNGCRSALVPMVITIHAVPSTPVPAQTEYCAGEGLSATTDPGTTLSWIAPNGTAYGSVNNANVGTYRVYAVNSSNCHSDTVAVTVNAFPSVPTANDVTICAPGAVNLSVNNPAAGTTYTWYADASHNNVVGTGATVNVNATTSTPHFYVTAKNGSCESGHAVVNVTIRETIPAPAISNIVACGGNATLPATFGSYSLSWKNAGNETVSDLSLTNVTGSVNYTATYEVNGCTSQPATVNVAFAEVPSISAQGDTRCGAGAVELTATSAGNTLHWFANEANANAFTNELATGGTYTPNVSNTTTYYVRALSEQGCRSDVANAVATVNKNNDMLATTPITHCGPVNIALNATGNSIGSTLSWYSDANGDNAVANTENHNVNATTTFFVASIDGNGCRSALVPMVVTIHDVPSTPVPTQAEYCAGDVLSATTDQGTTLSWIAPNGTAYGSVNNANVGTYHVYAINSSNCHSDTVAVTVNAFPSVPTANDVTICAPGVVNLSVNNSAAGTIYTWYADASHNNVVGTGATVNVNATTS